MKVNIKDRVMKCYMCGKWTRLDDSGLCPDCRAQKEIKISSNPPQTHLDIENSSKNKPE